MFGAPTIADKLRRIMLPLHRVSTHPGRILLKEFLEPLGLTQVKLASAINIPQNRVNELIRGKRGMTPETALLLSEYFQNSAEFWMNLQTAYDLTRVRAELRKRPATVSRNRSRPARGRIAGTLLA
jgi:addiction module HigA family antidote